MEWSKVARDMDQDDHGGKDGQNMPEEIKAKVIGLLVLHSRHHRGCD